VSGENRENLEEAIALPELDEISQYNQAEDIRLAQERETRHVEEDELRERERFKYERESLERAAHQRADHEQEAMQRAAHEQQSRETGEDDSEFLFDEVA
jgi:hypothetical protein